MNKWFTKGLAGLIIMTMTLILVSATNVNAHDSMVFKSEGKYIIKKEAAEAIWGIMNDLCNISGYGIHSGIHPGPKADKAAKYILSKLSDPRVLHSKLNTRLESVQVDTPWPNSWELTVLGTPPKEIFSHPIGWTVGTPADGVVAQLAYVREGTETWFKKVDVKGKIALVDHVSISNYVTDSSAAYTNSANLAVKYGAVGVIFAEVYIDVPKFYSTGSPTSVYPLPAFSCGKTEGNYLVNLAQSGAPTPVRMKLNVPHPKVNSYNVVAELEGNGSTDEIMIVQCHYDNTFTGALDNNEAVAMLIGYAKYFASLPKSERNRDMIFLFGIGHDTQSGNQGFQQFVAAHTDIMKKAIVFELDHVLAGKEFRLINDEFVPTGKDTTRKIYVTNYSFNSIATFFYDKYGLPGIVNRIPKSGATSDYFVAAGTPNISAMVGTTSYYHTILDTQDNLSINQIKDSFPVSIEILRFIDRTPEGYLIYVDHNAARIPQNPVPPEIGIALVADTVFVGDKAIAWVDFLKDSGVLYEYANQPAWAGITWDWGDGTTPHQSSASYVDTHVYTKPGTYTLKVTLTNLLKAQGMDIKTITVLAP